MLNTTDNRNRIQRFSRVLLWSIRFQDQLAYYIKLYLYSAVTFVLFLGFCQIISLDAALEIILVGGMTFCIGLGLFIFKRRSWLLHIVDPELKREAHAAMLVYITARENRAGQKRSSFTGDCSNKDCNI